MIVVCNNLYSNAMKCVILSEYHIPITYLFIWNTYLRVRKKRNVKVKNWDLLTPTLYINICLWQTFMYLIYASNILHIYMHIAHTCVSFNSIIQVYLHIQYTYIIIYAFCKIHNFFLLSTFIQVYLYIPFWMRVSFAEIKFFFSFNSLTYCTYI